MKKKLSKNVDVAETMLQIQAQLASLDKKLEMFITKSLTEIAQALAAQKTALPPRPAAQPSFPVRPHEPPRRPMFAIICFECGKDAEIPFKPSPGRAVYCPECFAKRKAGNALKQNSVPKPPVVLAAAVKSPEPAAKDKKKTPAAKKPAARKKTAAKKKK